MGHTGEGSVQPLAKGEVVAERVTVMLLCGEVDTA